MQKIRQNEKIEKSCLYLTKFVIWEISFFLLLFDNLTRNKLIFEFSLVFLMLNILIEAIVFGMENAGFFFIRSYIEELGLIFLTKYTFIFSKYLFELFFWTSDGQD